MKFACFLAGLLLCTQSLSAQYITSGPVVGAMTDTGFRVYIQTSPNGVPQPQIFSWEVATDASFGNIVRSGVDSTRATLFGGVTLDVEGLQPATLYYYRFNFGGQTDERRGQAKTFAPVHGKGHYKIAVGSCGYGPNDPLYQRIKDFEPDVFLHLGDWHWPPAQFGNDLCLYPERRAGAFAERYSDASMRKLLLPYFPIDYVYDDDFSWNDGEGWTYPTFTVTNGPGGAVTELYTNPMPPGIREGAIQGYFDHFPAYPAADTSAGIYHSFRLGNAAFFMLDTRNNRTPRHDAFVKDASGKFSYQPPAGHTMLGEAQRKWLVEGLKNSDADWNFIGSSVIFNKNYGVVLDVGLTVQNLALPVGNDIWTGVVIASQMAYNWAGYPADQDTLLHMAERGEIRNVIALSGDSHANMIDDGTNAGLPELSASGLAANDEGTVNAQISQIAGFLGYPSAEQLLWNGGGNGLAPNASNARDGFGTIDIFGADSVRLCVFDETGLNMGCKTILNQKGVSVLTPNSDVPALTFVPNPAQGQLKVLSNQTFTRLQVFDVAGRPVDLSVVYRGKEALVDLTPLAKGVYFAKALGEKGGMVGSGQFVKN